MASLFQKINKIKDQKLKIWCQQDLRDYFDPSSEWYKDSNFLKELEERVENALKK